MKTRNLQTTCLLDHMVKKASFLFNLTLRLSLRKTYACKEAARQLNDYKVLRRPRYSDAINNN